MDAPAVDPAALRGALAFIRRVNTALRYNAATLRALEELLPSGTASPERSEEKPWPAAEGESISTQAEDPRHGFSSPRGLGSGEAVPLTILDIATGTADLPGEILEWGRRRGLDIRCFGLDRHPLTLSIAREWAPAVPLVRGDALSLPFADASVDVATCGMFLHHLETAAAVRVIREMERITRRGWIVSDLLRRRRALAWITLFTLFAGPLVRHDARTSVRQAWTPAEARALAAAAGAPAEYRETFGHRFLLVRRKTTWPKRA